MFFYLQVFVNWNFSKNKEKYDINPIHISTFQEFEDAIMGELMEDPVILPGSGKAMDRKNIVR